MGASTGICEAPGESARLIRLASGTYGIEGLSLVHKVSIQGAGEDRTVIEGTVLGLRPGAVLSHVTVTKGTSGGICITDGGAPEIRQCTISGNVAEREHVTLWWSGGHGGGVYCADSSPILTGCTISGNWAARGGGVYCENSSPSMIDCAISGNWAEMDEGEALYCETSSPILANCAIFGNSAHWGATVYCMDSSPRLTNCTITGNSGSGVSCRVSSPTLTNCIVWGNTFEWVCGDVAHSLTDRDPLFVKPGVFDFDRFVKVEIGDRDYWLPDFTVEAPDYHLQFTSPAIDTGTSEGAPKTDIEGTPRPCWRGIDIGAYEYCGDVAPEAHFRRGDPNGDGRISLADAVEVLLSAFGAGSELLCQKSADCDDSGKLELADAIYLLTFIFRPGTDAPKIPYPDCGIDPTPDGLSCLSYPLCAP